MPASLPQPSWTDIAERYDALLIDAYGVLVDKHRALPGAAELLRRADASDLPWLIATNSASRLPETLASEFSDLGLAIPAERILTSGALLAEPGLGLELAGKRALVLGPVESRTYAERGGARATAPGDDAEVLIVADQKSVRFPEDMNAALSLMLRRIDAGEPLDLVLCNPDLIYPVREGQFGFTAGGLAAMLEAVLRERWPHRNLGFQRLGKPNRPIFDAACARLGAKRPLMIGDQLGTDIAGADTAGIDSLLVGSGLAPRGTAAHWPVRPSWYLPSLDAF